MNRILGDRYEILEKIGEGGMAFVYKAKCRLLNRFVAIKILRPEFLEDKKFIENFRRESQASAGMNHPNIVNIYDVGIENDDIYYIVMEYVEGRTLNSIIQEEGMLNDYETVLISKQIASALSCAHKNNIIHRDVKPHNIIVTYDGVAKITDFGIARAVTNTTLVATDSIMGSVHYFSPEQAKGGYVDGRSDLYSLGIMMYEMVTGRVPFDGENPVSIAMKHIKEEMILPSKYNPKISGALEKIIIKATQKLPGDRFADADEMIAALNMIVSQKPNYLEIFDDGKDYDNEVIEEENVNDSQYSDDEYEAPYDEDNEYYDDNYPDDYDNDTDDNPEDDRFVEYINQNNGVTNTYDSIMDNQNSGKKTRKQKKAEKKAAKLEKKRHKKKKITAPRVLGVIMGIVLAVFSSKGLLMLKDIVFLPDIEVPDLIGMNYEQAENLLDSYGLEFKITDREYSNNYEIGEVIDQNPYEGQTVKKGACVEVSVSKGADEADLEGVPDVVGKTLEEAEETILKAGYRIGTVTKENSTKAEGIIISQDPDVGEEAKEKSLINLVVSSGKDSTVSEVTMMNLVGSSLDSAKEMLSSSKLVLNNVEYEYSDKYSEGKVIGQSISMGEKAAVGTRVNLTVSKGSNGTESNGSTSSVKTIPLVLDYSSAQNDAFEIRINMVKGDNVSLVHDSIHYKSNQGEKINISGSGSATLLIYFDNKLVSEGTADFDTGKFSN